MTTSGVILVGGRAVLVEAPVKTWHETGMKFPAVRPRAETRLVVNHWTGAENPPDALFRNMSMARLSVHFAVDQRGVVYQFMDAVDRGAHCQAYGANGYAVGIEIISRGVGLDLPDRGVVRPTLREKIHGAWVRYAAFTSAQVATCLALNEALCRAFELPMVVPQRFGDVLSTTLTMLEAQRVRGCVGHYQLERGKVDPGMELLRAIHASGVELAGSGVA